MKFILAILILIWVDNVSQAAEPVPSTSQVELMTLDDWLDNTIDSDVLQAVRQLDEKKVRLLFSELQQAMQGTNLSQLATLRETATQFVPLLQKFDATAPYGDWLQTRLDYLRAAESWQQKMNAFSAVKKNRPMSLAERSNMEKRVWVEEIQRRPLPPLAQKYIPELKTAFAAERVPPELAWVAEVESSFNSRARSPAGAAGMFQLMPQTARDEQLSLWPRDQRYQPEKSAHAAAKFLRALHAHYGNWPLAFAAYNTGQAHIDKLLKQHHARSFEAIAHWLPLETQMYVPKVIATIEKRERKELSQLEHLK